MSDSSYLYTNNLENWEFDKEVALNLSQTKPAPKQLNLNKLSDAGGSQRQERTTQSKTDSPDCLCMCPCCNGKAYEQCCKPLHEGALAENALQLMRSRYSAYVLNLPDYIVATTHPASPNYSENKFAWKRSISQFSKSSTFLKLDILDSTENTVTFTAYVSQEGHDATFTERSYFEKIGKQWFYRYGQIEQGHVPNLVTTSQLRLLPLAYYGDPILEKKADPIAEITEDIKKLVEEMVETMDASDGLGLAAPQIHHSIRLFVIREPIETEQDRLEHGKVKVFINPTLSNPSSETWKASEGCLSIPTIRALVERPKEITVAYTTLEGKQLEERFSGWQARVILHEYDHIEGILFTDRLNEEERQKLAPALFNLKKRIHDRHAF